MDDSDPAQDGDDSLGVMERTFEIVEHLAAVDEKGVTELANELDLPKTTVHSYLKTLENIDYAINNDGKYRLSLRILLHAGQLRHSYPLFQTGRAAVDRFARETG